MHISLLTLCQGFEGGRAPSPVLQPESELCASHVECKWPSGVRYGHLLVARHVHYTKHLDTNTSSKNSVYIVQLYGSPVCPKLKIAKSGHQLCRKGLMKFDQNFRFLNFLQLDPEKSIL